MPDERCDSVINAIEWANILKLRGIVVESRFIEEKSIINYVIIEINIGTQ